MKRIIFSLLLIFAIWSTLIASVSTDDISFETVRPAESLAKLLRDKVGEINDELDKVGGLGNIGTGNIYYVDSAVGSDSYDGLLPEHAFATIDTAIGACTASNGDIIYVMQGHSETKSATGALFTADMAGVTIRGLGIGDNRPKLTLSHTGAKIDITADNVRFSNFYIDVTGVDSVNTPLNISGVGDIVDNLFVYMADDDGQADVFITVGIADGDANDLIISDCRFVSPIAGAASAISFAKDMKNVVLNNLNIYGDFSNAGIDIPSGGNACKNVVLANSFVYNLNSGNHAVQVNGTSCTGAILNCTLIADAEATILDAGGLVKDESTQLVVIGTGEGAALPANTTLIDLIGDYTGPDDGAAADDNIKAHLDLIKTAVDATLVDTAAQDTEAEIADLGSALVDDIQEAIDANSTQLAAIVADTAAQDTEAEWADLSSTVVDNIVAAVDANSTVIAAIAADTAALDSEAEIADLGSTLVDNIVAAVDANSTYVSAIAADTAAMDSEAEWADLGSTLVDNIVAAVDANSTYVSAIAADTAAMDSEAEWADLGSTLVDNIVAAIDANSTGVPIATAGIEGGDFSTGCISAAVFAAAIKPVQILVIETSNFNGNDYQVADSPVTIGTVTGDVLVQVTAVVGTACTSTGTNGTLELGTTDSTASLLVQDVVDGVAFQVGDVWVPGAGADNDIGVIDADWNVIGGSQDIILTIATNDMTAGIIKFYVYWVPLSSGATITDAAP